MKEISANIAKGVPYIDAVIVVLTTNPKFGEIDAVTEPLAILFILNDNADSGISLNPAPLPLKKEPSLNVSIPSTLTLPSNVEPLSVDVTTNPALGATVALTAPLTILSTFISVNSAPLPLKVDAVTNVPTLSSLSVVTEPMN